MHRLLEYCSLPLEFAVIFMAGVFGGYFVDKFCETIPLFTIVGLLAGLAAGLYHLIKTSSKLNSKS